MQQQGYKRQNISLTTQFIKKRMTLFKLMQILFYLLTKMFIKESRQKNKELKI